MFGRKLSFGDSLTVAKSAVVGGVKTGATITAGNIINQRVVNLVKPMLPPMIRGYFDSEIAQSALAAVVATLIVQFMSDNKQAIAVANAMFESAGVNFVGSFNLEAKFNELVAGIDLSTLVPTAPAAQGE